MDKAHIYRNLFQEGDRLSARLWFETLLQTGSGWMDFQSWIRISGDFSDPKPYEIQRIGIHHDRQVWNEILEALSSDGLQDPEGLILLLLGEENAEQFHPHTVSSYMSELQFEE